jgi:hypothetical protein
MITRWASSFANSSLSRTPSHTVKKKERVLSQKKMRESCEKNEESERETFSIKKEKVNLLKKRGKREKIRRATWTWAVASADHARPHAARVRQILYSGRCAHFRSAGLCPTPTHTAVAWDDTLAPTRLARSPAGGARNHVCARACMTRSCAWLVGLKPRRRGEPSAGRRAHARTFRDKTIMKY